MRFLILAAVSALVFTTPIHAATTDQKDASAKSGDASAAQAADDSEKKVCRKVTSTGSIMAKRVCMTKKLWAQVDAEMNSNSARALENKGGSRGGGGADF